MEERGFEPRASRMRSERSTTELHPLSDMEPWEFSYLNVNMYTWLDH